MARGRGDRRTGARMTDMTSTPPRAAARSLTYAQWMRAADEERTRLLRLLGGLPDDRGRPPPDCDRWSVRDIVAHLAGAAASTATVRELVRQARLGRRLGSEGDLVDRMNRIQVGERSGLSTAALTA